MDEQTRKLYEECNTGCQMAIESMQQIKDFTQDTTLFQLIEKYIDRHSRLGGNAKDHLIDSGNEVKAPGMMASAQNSRMEIPNRLRGNSTNSSNKIWFKSKFSFILC